MQKLRQYIFLDRYKLLGISVKKSCIVGRYIYISLKKFQQYIFRNNDFYLVYQNMNIVVRLNNSTTESSNTNSNYVINMCNESECSIN